MIASLWANSGWWANILVIVTSVGSIFFFLKKILVKTIAEDIKSLDKKVSPNGKNTQNIGDIAARLEDVTRDIRSVVEEIKTDGKHTKEMVIEHLGWHKGVEDSRSFDNVKSIK